MNANPSVPWNDPRLPYSVREFAKKIDRFAERLDELWHCSRRIAKWVGLGLRRVQMLIKALIETDWIERVPDHTLKTGRRLVLRWRRGDSPGPLFSTPNCASIARPLRQLTAPPQTPPIKVSEEREVKPDNDKAKSSPIFSAHSPGDQEKSTPKPPTPEIRAEAVRLATKAHSSVSFAAAIPAKVESLARKFGWPTLMHALSSAVSQCASVGWGWTHNACRGINEEGGPPPPPMSREATLEMLIERDRHREPQRRAETERKAAAERKAAEERRAYLARRQAAEDAYLARAEQEAAERHARIAAREAARKGGRA
jgi:hypothetical protein